MIKTLAWNVNMRMQRAYQHLGLLGHCQYLPVNPPRPNPHHASNGATPDQVRAARDRGRRQKRFFRKIKRMVAGKGYATLSDIGTEDFLWILRWVCALPELDENVRSESWSTSHLL